MSIKTRNFIFKAAVIVAAVLIVQNIMLLNRINILEKNLSNVKSSLSMSIDNLDYKFYYYYQQMLQNERLSYDETVNIGNYVENGTVEAEILFSLKEYQPDADVSVYVNNSKSGIVHTTAKNIGNGKFSAMFSLSVQGDYSFSFESNGNTVTTGILIEYYSFENELLSRFKTEIGCESENIASNSNYIKLGFYPYIINCYDGRDVLKIKNASLRAVSDGKELWIKDLTQYIVDDGTIQSVVFGTSADQMIKMAAGEIPPSETDNSPFYTEIQMGKLELILTIEDNLGINYSRNEVYEYTKRSTSSSSSNLQIVH